MSNEQFFKWVDKNFGLGGLENYDNNTVIEVRNFLKVISSSFFSEAEQKSLIKILKKFHNLNLDNQDEIGEYFDDINYKNIKEN